MSRKRAQGQARAPTWTSLVLSELVRRDDLVSASDLCRALGCTRDQMWAATHQLVRYKAAVRVESDREAHFFATLGDDTRVWLVASIATGITRSRSGGDKARKHGGQDKGLQRELSAAQSDACEQKGDK